MHNVDNIIVGGLYMKTKFRKPLSTLLAFAMIFAVFAAMPLTANAEDGPFQVTLQPISAVYYLNEAAIPLKATFNYSAGNMGYIDHETVIKVKWYWSYDNSNTSRINGLGESDVAYGRVIEHTTTHVPATDVLGVKYYYAVLTYAESVHNGEMWTSVPKEAVTNPARIEVISRKHGFEVKKVDTAGNPLSGAVISLASAYGESDPAYTSYTETTAADGFAQFNVEAGYYILSEKEPPAGYTGDSTIYYILITPEGVFFYNPNTQSPTPYELVTFVNEKIQGPSTHSFLVRKTDADGNPLAGAIIRLEGLTEGGTPRVYDVTTNNAGEAVFTVEPGTYELSEWAAPTGYNASGDRYKIVVTASGVYFDKVTHIAPYTVVTFINKKIPGLEKVKHYAYMQGYPDGEFKPGRNMTRAEAVVMFSRLLENTINLTTDYRANYYPDVDYTNPWLGQNTQPWYANQVCYMHFLGALGDFSRDGKFRPNDPVTRAEFAVLAAHFDNLTLTSVNVFTDVPNSHWAVKYINSAAAKGWIAGYPDHTFRPENNITRAEVVTLVNRILERKADQNYVTTNYSSLPRTYSDISAAHWAYWDIMEASIRHDYDKVSGGEKWTAVYSS